MKINSNIAALTAFNSLTSANNQLQKTIKQLSTGLKINSAADDAAGLAISENMRAQSNGLERALMNAQDGISLLQTAEGALGETNSMLQRMRELAIEAANDTLTAQDRSYIQMEIDDLKNNIDRIADTTQFNNKRILDGSVCGSCSSTDESTKGYIRGALEAEGNYRIEVRSKPGVAQVQKSAIFKVKHQDVVTNSQLNPDNGVIDVSVDNLPAGNFNITATKPGGGDVIATYKTTVNVTSGNTSGVEVDTDNLNGIHETLYFRLTAENNEKGTKVYWPRPDSQGSNYNLYNYGNYDYDDYIRIDIPQGATKSDIQRLILNKINENNGSLTMYSNSSGADETNFDVSAELDENGQCVITSSSTEGVMSKIEFLTVPATTTSVNQLTKEGETAKTYTAELQGGVVIDSSVTSASELASETVDIVVKSGSNTENITVSLAGLSGSNISEAVASAINTQFKAAGSFTLNGKNITLDYKAVAGSPSDYRLTAKADDGTSDDISITVSTTSSLVKLPDAGTSSIVTEYTTAYKGSVNSGNINTSGNTEYLRILCYKGSSPSNVYVPITTDIETSQDVVKKIREAITSDNSLKSFLLPGTVSVDYSETDSSLSEGEYIIRAKGTNAETSFSISFHQPDDPTTTSVNHDAKATTQIENGEFVKDGAREIPGSVANLTGFYGDTDIAKTLSGNIKTYVDCENAENNASILFEVTGSSIDPETGQNVLTLAASSQVLKTDGSQDNFTKSKILFSATNQDFVNIGGLLGEDEEHLKLKLPDISKFNIGDKFVLSVSGNGAKNSPADVSLYINGSQDSKWPYSWDKPDGRMTYNNNDLYYNLNAEKASNRHINFRNYYLNSDNGRVTEANINLTLSEDFATAAKNFPNAPAEGQSHTDNEITLASFTSNYVGKVADGATQLRDIEQFWNKSGVFMLEQPQTITISQNDGKKASITLNASDTLNDVRRKLNDAIANDLGQGLYVTGGDANKIVTFVENPIEGSGIETVKGTFLIRSLIPGSDGELTFSSSYGELIDRLGLNTIQQSQEGSYSVSVYNAHDDTVIATNIKTSGNVLMGVIDKNLDVEFDPMAGVTATWSEHDKNFILTPQNETYTTFLHVVKNNISFHTGANEGEIITLDIGDMSSAGLGIQGVNLMTHDRAERAITILDNAIKQVSAQRSKIGSYQNALEHTIENLTVTNTSLISAESRIRDVDMSKAALDLVKFQIINQSASSMLAQANQIPQSVLSLIQ